MPIFAYVMLPATALMDCGQNVPIYGKVFTAGKRTEEDKTKIMSEYYHSTKILVNIKFEVF
jgi:hypothetical protein